jgi:glutathione S-transferase
MLTIWGRLNSHNVKKVVWAAVETGAEWERHDIGGVWLYARISGDEPQPAGAHASIQVAISRCGNRTPSCAIWPMPMRRICGQRACAGFGGPLDGLAIRLCRCAARRFPANGPRGRTDRDAAKIERTIAETNKLMGSWKKRWPASLS